MEEKEEKYIYRNKKEKSSDKEEKT